MLFTIWLFACLAGFGVPESAAAETGTLLRVWPASSQITVCEEVQIAVQVDNVTDLTAYSIVISFDPQLVEILEVGNGGFLDQGLYEPSNKIDNTAGTIRFGMAQLEASPKTGSGDLLYIHLKPKKAGQTASLTIDKPASVLVNWPDALPVPYETINGTIKMTGCYPLFLPLITR